LNLLPFESSVSTDAIPIDLSFESGGIGRLFDPAVLWQWTKGNPQVSIAVLDGPVDFKHESLAQSEIRLGLNVTSPAIDDSLACRHGSHITSVIFGQHTSSVQGIAPECSGIILPIYSTTPIDALTAGSQLDLARMILQALAEGANVINISGGEFSPSGQAHPLLADAIRECERADVLIVAAAGNQGCDCLNVPASLGSVLAVGAMDANGEPLAISNFGHAYQSQGIVAPGKDLLGARPGGGTFPMSGTSAASAWVSGVIGLLLSFQIQIGQKPSPSRIRRALLESALDCDSLRTQDCKRILVGRINIPGAISLLLKDKSMASHPDQTGVIPSQSEPAGCNAPNGPTSAIPRSDAGVIPSASVQPQACSCGGGGAKQIVYVLGQVHYDMISEARLDAFAQKMGGQGGATPARALPNDPIKMLEYLEENPYEASALEWTVNLDGTPIYAVRPSGPFAADGYKYLRNFLTSQLKEDAERVSIPGVISGNARLITGQVVPVIVPELRGMYCWSTEAIVNPKAKKEVKEDVKDFLDRIYFGLRNLGVLPQDRAINFAATNAFNIEKIFDDLDDDLDHESMRVVPSPFGRPGSDCWDVEIYFFYPKREVQSVRKVYRFTVDVSDTVPVTVGPMRNWMTR
jgi:PatG C-terminal/Subtilase family/PatG Domain